MTSRNIHEEYFTINNIKDKDKKGNIERSNRFSLSKPNFLNKSKISLFLTSLKNGNKKEKSNINKNSIETSISLDNNNNKKLNKVFSNKKNIQMEKSFQAFINKNKSSNNNNKIQNNKKDFSLNTLNFTIQNHISLNNTNKSLFKETSKTKSLKKPKYNNDFQTTEYSNKKIIIKNNIKKNRDSFKFNLIKKKAIINKKKFIFIHKENPINQYNEINFKCLNDSKLENNNIINSERLTDRYKKIVLNKNYLTERTIIPENRIKDDKYKTINKKKFSFSDLKMFNQLEKRKNKNEIKEKINNKKIDLSALLKSIISDTTNNSRNINSSQNMNKSKESENNINNSNKINKTLDNIKNIKTCPKLINVNNMSNNSTRKRSFKNIKEIISEILKNTKENNIDYNNSFIKSARNIINSKRESFNSNKNKKRINCNLLIFNNNEKKDLYTHAKNYKSNIDKSKLLEYNDFKIKNNKKEITKQNDMNIKNKSRIIENMSRNNKSNYNLTNSITIENNNTNYISPKQYEKEDNTTNNMNTPLIYNKIVSMTMNNSLKMTLNNSIRNKVNKNINQDKKICKNKNNNLINKKIHKKIILHNKRLSIPLVSQKTSIISKKIKNSNKITSKLSLTPTIKDYSFIQKMALNNSSKIKEIKKIIKIDSCTVPGYSIPGIPKINQDNYFIIKEFLNNKEQFFIGLCDGHGSYGHLISKYICNILPKKIKKISEKEIVEAILSTNKSLIEESKIDCSLSGSTCNALMISKDKIISANVGNTRSVLARYENGQYNAINLTRDHKPTELDEMKRILNSNGRIKQYTDPRSGQPTGPERIWLNNSEIPGLSISRSLGDNLAHSIGVICEPEIKEIEFNGNEKFILVASDGIWKFIDSDESVKIIKDFYENNMDAVGALNKIVKQAFKRWKNEEDNMDDITAILIFFE